MLTIKVGKTTLAKPPSLIVWFLRAAMVLVPALIVVVLILQLYSNPLKGLSPNVVVREDSNPAAQQQPAGTCFQKKECPKDQFSFFIQSGAANAIGPQICVHNNLVLGAILNNAGSGINIVTLNGKTGEILKTANFNMYSGEVEPLIKFLKDIEQGAIVLFVSFDEPASKLNQEARKLIAEMGSSVIQTLGYRDSWAFVGGRGATVKSTLEKHVKNEKEKNKYDNWPELVQMEGCLPKLLE